MMRGSGAARRGWTAVGVLMGLSPWTGAVDGLGNVRAAMLGDSSLVAYYDFAEGAGDVLKNKEGITE